MNENEELTKKTEEVIDHQTEEVNPETRKAIASKLDTFLGKGFWEYQKKAILITSFKVW